MVLVKAEFALVFPMMSIHFSLLRPTYSQKPITLIQDFRYHHHAARDIMAHKQLMQQCNLSSSLHAHSIKRYILIKQKFLQVSQEQYILLEIV